MISDGQPRKEQRGLTGPQQGRRQFGNYDLIERIDTGGMGEVYRAYQRTAFNREVAVKIIRRDLAHDPVARERFSREAEVSSHLKHEHILPLFDYGQVDGQLFLVTPYIAGGNLSQRLRNGPLPLEQVQQLFTPLVQAVAYIHRRGIVHRDLKPSNVLLDTDDETGEVYVRLIDFGIAKRSGAAASPPLTTAGHEMGTLVYMAPERLNGIAAPSNDIYSLGVILYQMLTGRLPVGEARIPLLPPLEAVVRRCMAPDPEDRYTSASEVLHDFEQACYALTSHPEQDLNPPAASGKLEARSLQATDLAMVQDANTARQMGGLSLPSISSPAQPQPGKIGLLQDADFIAPTVDFAHFNPSTGNEGGATGTQSRPVPAIAASNGLIVPTGTVKTASRRRKRKSPLFAIISVLIVVVLLIMAGLLFLEFPLVASANVNISPQVHVLRQVYTITAQPSQTSIDVATRSIPALGKTVNQTLSQTGETTGLQCSFFFDCKRVVSVNDVENLSNQLRQTLISQISAQIDQQLQAIHATEIGQKQFTDLSESSNPNIGAESKTVTVTLTEQGSVEYINGTDAQKLAQLLLTQDVQKLGPGNVLENFTVQIGQPVVESVSEQGIVTIEVAAAGVAEYQFSAQQLQTIGNHLTGLTLQQARTYLQRQPGVDPKSINIRFTLGGGNTLPYNTSQIKLIPINPISLPSASLPPVPTPAVTPSNLTPSPTVTDNNG
ncbi:MAG TPA: serine/threonine-protein kinase [Ktedonobacteraceae bacterium]|nr:serine/threonine-protein kinase [Ktedonobacteraceae bacterium]